MRTAASPPAAPPPDDSSAERRVHIKGIKELPAGYDSEIGTIFCEMRRASQLTKDELAVEYQTDISTFDALEAGALLALPDWPETSRVVSAYTEALGLDGGPILRRMATQLAPEAVARRPADPPEYVPPAPKEPPAPDVPNAYADFEPASEDELRPPPATEEAAAPPRRSALGRAIRWLAILLMLGAGSYGAWFAWQRPALVSSTLDRLPEPIPSMVRKAWEVLRPLAPASDPKSRKSDKLPVGGETSAN